MHIEVKGFDPAGVDDASKPPMSGDIAPDMQAVEEFLGERFYWFITTVTLDVMGVLVERSILELSVNGKLMVQKPTPFLRFQKQRGGPARLHLDLALELALSDSDHVLVAVVYYKEKPHGRD